MLKEEVSVKDARGKADGLVFLMDGFSFALTLHLMKNVLNIWNELLEALHKKDQYIINGSNLVNITKEWLQTLRDDDREPFIEGGRFILQWGGHGHSKHGRYVLLWKTKTRR